MSTVGFEASLKKQFPNAPGMPDEVSVAHQLGGLNRALGGDQYVEDYTPPTFAKLRQQALDGPRFARAPQAPRIPLPYFQPPDSDGRMPRLPPHIPTRFKPMDKDLLMRRLHEFLDTEIYHRNLMQMLNEARGY